MVVKFSGLALPLSWGGGELLGKSPRSSYYICRPGGRGGRADRRLQKTLSPNHCRRHHNLIISTSKKKSFLVSVLSGF